MGVINNLAKPNNLDPIAVCDCWKRRADEGQGTIKAKHSMTEYKKLLDLKEVDYVVVAVPEHWHVDMTIDAMDAGKAVYCEKPMTHTIPEAQAVMKKQKETGRPLQVGVQAMSDDSYITARDAIRKGVIGKVIQAQIEYVRRYDSKKGPWREPELVSEHATKPADLDWNAWLGKAPKTEWNPIIILNGDATLSIQEESAPTSLYIALHALCGPVICSTRVAWSGWGAFGNGQMVEISRIMSK